MKLQQNDTLRDPGPQMAQLFQNRNHEKIRIECTC